MATLRTAARATERESRPYDVVIWGATGFTGQLVGQYLAEKYTSSDSKEENVTFAIAGRNKEKLEAVKQKIMKQNPDCNPAILVGNARDQDSVDAVAAQARVVCATAGPYALFGEAMFSACARLGTDYVDITGETTWVRDMTVKYSSVAEESGALLVPMCGFDSIPSDMGTYFMVKELKKRGAQAREVHAYFSLEGGVSGGTVATIMNMMSQPKDKLRAMMNDVFIMNDEPHKRSGGGLLPHDRDFRSIAWSNDINAYHHPFLMAGANTRVVRRSNQLLEYGPRFSYNETQAAKGLCGALGFTLGLGCFTLLAATSFGRSCLGCCLPTPGQGPSEKQMRTGWFKTKLVAVGTDGKKAQGEVNGGEPGYFATSRMLTESALCMLRQRSELRVKSGIYTTASGLGDVLLGRLPRAGVTFTLHSAE